VIDPNKMMVISFRILLVCVAEIKELMGIIV